MRDQNPESDHNANTNPEGQRPYNQDWHEPGRDRQGDRQGKNRDPLRGLLPGLILILLGVLLFLATRGVLSWATWWQYFLIGLGLVFIVDGLAHYANPALRDMSFGRFIPGVILLFVGLAFVYGFSEWWPLILIAVGVIILLNLLFRRR